MSEVGAISELAVETPFPGVERRTFHSSQSTVVSYVFAAGAKFPLHRHPEEQITLIEDGDVELTAGGTTQTLAAGGWSVVAGDVEHGIRAGAQGARFLAILVPRRRADQEPYIITDPIPNEELP